MHDHALIAQVHVVAEVTHRCRRFRWCSWWRWAAECRLRWRTRRCGARLNEINQQYHSKRDKEPSAQEWRRAYCSHCIQMNATYSVRTGRSCIRTSSTPRTGKNSKCSRDENSKQREQSQMLCTDTATCTYMAEQQRPRVVQAALVVRSEDERQPRSVQVEVGATKNIRQHENQHD